MVSLLPKINEYTADTLTALNIILKAIDYDKKLTRPLEPDTPNTQLLGRDVEDVF